MTGVFDHVLESSSMGVGPIKNFNHRRGWTRLQFKMGDQRDPHENNSIVITLN
jgi:hypothetical protein